MLVSLLQPTEARELGLEQEASTSSRLALQFVNTPIPDLGVPSDPEAFTQLLEQTEAHLIEGRNVGVHCRQSIGRSGLVILALLMRAGYSYDDATAAATIARGVPVPETATQAEWLRKLTHSA